MSPSTKNLSYLSLILLTVFWHLVLLIVFQRSFILWDSAKKPIPFPVQALNSNQLEEIRKSIKDSTEQPKKLLLDSNSKPNTDQVPKDAKYFSKNNHLVKEETRAAQTQIIPSSAQSPNNPAKPKKAKLADLGVKIATPEITDDSKEVTQPSQTDHSERDPTEIGDQSLNDRQLKVGSQNLLNTAESVYYSFYARLYETIGPLWQNLIRNTELKNKVRPGEYLTSVDLVLDQTGNLIEVRQMRSSGIAEFDQAVQLAWKKVGRFPNPPTGLLDSKNQVHTGWTFSVEVNEFSRFKYLPPERTY